MTPVKLRLTHQQWTALRTHLLPGDGCEAVAIALCGRRSGDLAHILTVHTIFPIPYDECKIRKPDQIQWSTKRLIDVLKKVQDNGWAIVKIHSHPQGPSYFSAIDDIADNDLFTSLSVWTETDQPHASAIMLPTGELIGRVQRPNGSWDPISRISVIGHDLIMWDKEKDDTPPAFAQRHAQTFGKGTTALMRRLTIGVIGCSGTGSPVIEQLARDGVGTLVLVDPDIIEEKNIGRIIGSGMDDAQPQAALDPGRSRNGMSKIQVMMRNITTMKLGTNVISFTRSLGEPEVVKAIATCDIVFGCMDSIGGRYLLNRLSACYLIPYFDVGVKLVADGLGGVSEACGAIHVCLPDGQSLMERRVFTSERLRAEDLKASDPQAYTRERKAGYIDGVDEDRPAVVSINFFMASLGVNELLARLHPYRLDGNDEYAIIRYSFMHGHMYHNREDASSTEFHRIIGRGDMKPLLDMPMLSEV